ncbi:homeobox protein H2.0-like [Eriocheir sinensis]|uniref:homeobox protein H2.0-like n=1 Tax=Eriocheir sinensis TaxID=95602 RepID=UPI0021C62EC0|nr:homeobox protein H2.0-like [Eriocheir sinensis]
MNMFVPRALPWELPPPPLPPLGGLLTMLESKEGIRSPFFLPTAPHVPRTAACVVLPRPASPTPAPAHAHARNSRYAPPIKRASSPPASTPPLKFGVERLLSAEPRKDTPSLQAPSPPHHHHHHHLQVPLAASPTSRLHQPSPTTSTASPSPTCTSGPLPPCLPHCGCEGGKCLSEPTYYYAPLYATHPAHLLSYPALYGGGVGGGGGHRGEVVGVGQAGGAHGRRKRTWTRAVFSNLQRKGLEKRFQMQKYITKPDRRQLAATLGLTDAQVKVWFQNRRMKWRHSELKKRDQQQQQQQQTQQTQQQEQPPQQGPQTDSQMEEEEEEEEEEESEGGMDCTEERNGVFRPGSEREVNGTDDTAAKKTL